MADRPSIFTTWKALICRLEDLKQASREAGTAPDDQLALELSLEQDIINDLTALTAGLGE